MHSNKLKRKLADLGLEATLGSSKLSESFCLIGTPLPPLEKAKDTGEFLPLWKQEVRDEKGRRRLHGAFTGGFSAGYYNTVGSAEGWTPSTFVSSRTDRANKKQARPEDYMDDEDLAELRENRKLVDATEESDLFSSAQQDSVTDALQNLIPPSRDSIGSRLLRKMGWKPGQGIGPRITYRQLKMQEKQLGSLSGWSTQAIEDGEDEEANKHMYPPRDTPLILYQRKENAFGIGYTPGARLEVSSGKADDIGSGPRLSAGFGLGALNDAEDDDIDVYDHGSADRSHQRHLAYDENEAVDELDRNLRTQRGPGTTRVKGHNKVELFSNGAPVLLGFALSKLSVSDDQWFEAPKPPDDWEPDPRRVWSETAEETQPPRPGSRTVVQRLTADQRGSVLGETPLPSAPRSVFDYLAPKDRDRLRNLAASAVSTRPGPEGLQQGTSTGAPVNAHSIPHTESSIAKAALSGFQPFRADPAKAARYTAYLKSQADPEEYPESHLKPALDQSFDAFYHELREFAKSATIFKPAAGVLGGRFATAKVVERLESGKEGLYVPGSGEDYVDAKEKPPAPEKKEDPKINAARLGMFGPLTRSMQDWDPAKLLCKRFGLKELVREFRMDTDVLTNGENDWKTQMPSLSQIPTGQEQSIQESEAIKPPTASFRVRGNDLSNVGLGEDDDQGRDTLTYVKPERDIFKAIFESDEESGSEEETVAPETLPQQIPVIPESKQPPETIPPKSQMTSDGSNYLTVGASTTDSYVPLASNTSTVPGSVDLSTFRPTFKSKAKDPGTQKEKKKSKEKDRRKGKAILSFEEEGDGLMLPEKSKRKKSKKEKMVVPVIPLTAVEDDTDMWVEKPPAEAVGVHSQNLDKVDVMDDNLNRPPGAQSGRRMRAVDFL